MIGESLAREALARMPQLLSALDRNPHSPTFGCFDRAYWLTGRSLVPDAGLQVGAWTLALAATARAPFNPFFDQPNLAEWALAAVKYTASLSAQACCTTTSSPGTPQGWTEAITLFACCETCRLLNEIPESITDWLTHRAGTLAGQKPNPSHSHVEAWSLLALHRAGQLLKTSDWNLALDHRLDRLLERQDAEGWFPEHGSMDPGLLTLTLSALAHLQPRGNPAQLQQATEKAITFLSQIVHPDGSFGGELYGSATHTWFPDGLEILGKTLPLALQLQDHLFLGLRKGLGTSASDIGWQALHSASCLVTWQRFQHDRPQPAPDAVGSLTFPHAELRVERAPGWTMFISLGRSGIFKLFHQQNLLAADTHFSLKVRDGKKLRHASGNISGFSSWEQTGDTLKISGQLAWQPSPPCLIGRLLQACGWKGCRCRCACACPTVAPFTFTRTFTEHNGIWTIADELQSDDWSMVESAGIAGDQTWKRHPASHLYQHGQLQPWFDITEDIRKLQHGERFKLERSL